jgi:YVTN family beta-propeller protein
LKALTVIVFVMVAAAVLVLLAVVALVAPNSPVSVSTMSSVAVANITINGYPDVIAVNPNTNRIYVSDLFNNTLTVVDASTYAVIDTVVLPGTSGSVVVDTRSNMVFVPVSGCTNEANVTNGCNSDSGSTLKGGIVEIDGNTDSIVGEIPINVDWFAIDSNKDTLYGINWNLDFGSNSSASLLAIDERSGSVIANTSLSAFPLGLAVNTKTDMVYVAACERVSREYCGAKLLLINGTNHDIQSVVPLSFWELNSNVVVDPTMNTVYAMGAEPDPELVSIDGTTGKIRYSSDICSSCGGGGTLALNTASNQVYVSFNIQQPFITIDGWTGKIVNMLSTPEGIQYVAFNPNTLQTYMTMEAQNERAGYFLIIPGQ